MRYVIVAKDEAGRTIVALEVELRDEDDLTNAFKIVAHQLAAMFGFPLPSYAISIRKLD